MNDIDPNPPAVSKPNLSWARNPRTSCDSCKQMKIKCQRNNGDRCARCTTRDLQCTTTPVERKRQKIVNKRSESYFDEMEDRIKRMESAIIASRLQVTPEPVEVKEEDKSSDRIESQAELADHLSNLVVDASGSSNFIGSASGFSLFSPSGLRWISEKIGDKEQIAALISKISREKYGSWGQGNADLWYPVPRSEHTPLPSKELALQYVNCFFTTYNSAFPVINRRVFNSYFERQYSTSPPESTAWYALFNTILCLGSIRCKGERERHIRTSCLIDYTSIAEEIGAKYFRNASACFHDLFFKEANLMSMQAMTLMQFITTSSPNPQPGYILTSAIGTLSNSLGLHRNSHGLGVTLEEIEQRRNVFWTFYQIEKAVSHNLGRPSVINDDDIAVDLPPKKIGLIQFPSGAQVYDIFQDQTTLAIIVSRICTELYSASSQTKSEADRMKVLGKLDNHLQRWRDAIPLEIRPEHPIKCSDEQYVPVVMMHFAYLDAVIMLHRLPSHQASSFQDPSKIPTSNHDQKPQLNPRVYASHSLCLAAARRSIHLLDTISNNSTQNQYLTWLALYYPLSASLVLFTNILSNPQDPHARADIQLMGLITSFIERSVVPGSSFARTPTLSMFAELFGIARGLVERVSSSSGQTRKRRGGEDGDIAPFNFFASSSQPQTQQHAQTQPQAQTQEQSNYTYKSLYPPPSHPQHPHPHPYPPRQESSTSPPSHRSSTQESTPLEFAPFIPSVDEEQLFGPGFEYEFDPMLLPPEEWDFGAGGGNAEGMWSFEGSGWGVDGEGEGVNMLGHGTGGREGGLGYE